MKAFYLFICGLMLLPAGGCSLKEIVSKTKLGPEFRHDGGSRRDSTRWSAQQGFQFKFDKGVSTSLTYRRRDTDGGDGDNDNGVWMEFAFPIWKAPKKPDDMARKVEMLEERLAELETR